MCKTSTRRKLNFSPICPVAAFNVSSIVVPLTSKAKAASKLAGAPSNKLFVISATNPKNTSLLAAKSVSVFTSIITALFPSTLIEHTPSAAIRLAFLAAFAIPFSLNQSHALSTSQSQASKAFLQSYIPAPLRSRTILINSVVTAIFISS